MRKDCMKIDFNNMLKACVGAHGITASEIAAESMRIPTVHAGVEAKRQENTWRALPYHQEEIIADIAQEGARINEKFDAFVVLGIGGSALGSKAMFTALKHLKYNQLPREKRGGARFYVADNIDPDGLSALFDVIDPRKTCFHVVTKSGNTVETMSQFMTVTAMLRGAVGADFSEHIVVTTDKTQGNLKRIADENGYKTYVVPDGVGGRFSVLCPVGLLSAAVLKIDIPALLAGARNMDKICSQPALLDNPAYMYAMLHYIAAKKGQNISVMLPYADALANTAEWYAQLWAESLGKRFDREGREVHVGQTPVRALGVTDQHSQIQLYTEGPFDKVVCFIEVEHFHKTLTIPSAPMCVYDAEYLAGQTFNKLIASEMRATQYAVTKAGKPNMRIVLTELDEYSFGALLYFLEMATAASGEFYAIDAFDQPGVEEGKIATFALMGREGYEEKMRTITADVAKDAEYCYQY